MKKQFTTALLLLVSFAGFAQFNQGTKMVGGNVEFSTTTYKVKDNNTTSKLSTTTEFAIGPQFGYFVIDRLALGAELNLSLSKRNDAGDDDYQSNTTLTFAPFVRYYLPQNIFFEGQIGLGRSKNVGETGGRSFENKTNVTVWSLGAGYAILLNESVAIEPMIGYGSVIMRNPNSDNRSVEPGLFIQVGFQIYIP